MMQCQICGLILLTLKLYVSHLRLVHAKDPAFSIMCGVSGCREVFRAFSAFSSHIYRHHRKAIGVAQPDSSQTAQRVLHFRSVLLVTMNLKLKLQLSVTFLLGTPLFLRVVIVVM